MIPNLRNPVGASAPTKPTSSDEAVGPRSLPTSARSTQTQGAVALLALVLTGCATQAQVRSLERESRERENRIAALEAQISTDLEEAMTRAQARVQELQEILEQATQAVTRNSADLVTEVEELRTAIARIDGQIAEIRNELGTTRSSLQQRVDEIGQQLERVASQAGVDLGIAESEIPSAPAEHFQAAEQAFQARDFGRARALLRVFATRYPRHDKADDAHFLIGMSYMQQNRPQNAVPSFQRVIQEHRRGDKVDETLLRMGEAFFQLRSCAEARTAYEALIQGHRNSRHVAAARRGLAAVQGASRAQCTP